ncbi:MAG: DUF4123 domain-containing protein [Pyrinomonadaceae bacterium]
MNKEKLDQHLIMNSTRLYGILDGASVPDLPTRLYEAQLPNHCLFKGDLNPDVAYVAPYLVYLPPEHKFTEWVISEGFGDACVIFAHSQHSLIEMRRHFRSLVNVYDEKGNSMTFRCYDPRVLRKYLPTCTPEELETFFGNVDTFFAESGDGEGLMSFTIENNALKQTELN